MLSNLLFGTAYAAGGGEHAGGGFFSEPESWVAIAFVLFVALLGKVLWSKITEMLDKRSAAIAKALGDAEKLRAEAMKAKADAENTLAQATAEAEGILAQARDEVGRMQARAAQSLENAIALREQQALDRIGGSEGHKGREAAAAALGLLGVFVKVIFIPINSVLMGK